MIPPLPVVGGKIGPVMDAEVVVAAGVAPR